MIALKKILVPVDFSEASKKAVTYGLTLARQFNAKLIVVHIVPESAALKYAFPSETSKIERKQADLATREIETLTPPEHAAGVDLETIVRIGAVEAELLGIVEREGIDLVVMGTQGRRYLGRWFLGSVTEHMLRKVPVPVSTVSHVEGERHAIGLVSLKRVLYATDLSESSNAGLMYAIALARSSGAALTVIHVIEYWDRMLGGPAVITHLEDQRVKLGREMRKTIDDLLAQDKRPEIQIETLVVEGEPCAKILETVSVRDMDIIVLNLQSGKILERAFLGSTAERVVRLASVPVLSVPVAAIAQP